MPASAPSPPRHTSDVTDTAVTTAVDGASKAGNKGNAAPTANVSADATAAFASPSDEAAAR